MLLSFQFHKGTIRTREPLARMKGSGYFNSIKVRLEPGTAPTRYQAAPTFQFHKGTIRTDGGKGKRTVVCHISIP